MRAGEERMLRGDDHEIDTKDRVGAGGIDPQRGGIAGLSGDSEIDLRAKTLADPVGLHFLHGLAVVHRPETFEQSVGIVGDPKIPLAQLFLDDGIAAAFADAVDHLVIGQDGTQRLAPIDFTIVRNRPGGSA